MADLEINVKGIAATVKSLNRIAASDAIRSAMQASVIEIETYMKKYPPKLAPMQGPAFVPARTFTTKAGASVTLRANRASGKGISMVRAKDLEYKRTGKLGQAWTTSVRQTATETVGKVGNAIKYAKWVQAADTQAWMHVGRWRTDRQAIAQFEAKIVKRFEDAIKRAMR